MKHKYRIGQYVMYIDGYKKIKVKIIAKTKDAYIIKLPKACRIAGYSIQHPTITDAIKVLKGLPMDRSLRGLNVSELELEEVKK